MSSFCEKCKREKEDSTKRYCRKCREAAESSEDHFIHHEVIPDAATDLLNPLHPLSPISIFNEDSNCQESHSNSTHHDQPCGDNAGHGSGDSSIVGGHYSGSNETSDCGSSNYYSSDCGSSFDTGSGGGSDF